MMHKAWRSIEEVPYCFSRSSIKFYGHTGGKIDDLNPIWDYKAGRSYQIPQICLVRYEALVPLHNIETFFQKIGTLLCGIQFKNCINPTHQRISFKLSLVLIKQPWSFLSPCGL